MRGSIERLPSGSYRVRIGLPKDPVTGKKRQLRRTVRGTRKEAERILHQLCLTVDRGSYASDITVGELFERWLAHVRLAPYTLDDYRRVVRLYLAPTFGKLQVNKLRAVDLDHLYDSLAAGGLGPARIYKVHTVARSALAQAVRWELIPSNPALNASPPSVERPDIVTPSPHEVDLLIAEAERSDPALLAFVFLAAASGARRGELCALRWADIDRFTGKMRIARSVWAVKGEANRGRWGIKETKTGRVRTIALDSATLEVLASHRKRCQEHSLAVGMPFDDQTFVFARELSNLTPWRPDVVSHRFRALRQRAGVDGATIQALRHYVASQLIAAGIDPVTVAARLGHAKPSTTLDLYAAFLPARDIESAEVLRGLRGQG